MRVHTSVRRSVLQPISRIRVLGQKSWISAFHCEEKTNWCHIVLHLKTYEERIWGRLLMNDLISWCRSCDIISNVAPGTSLKLTNHVFVISYLCNLGIKTQMIKEMFKAVKEFVFLNLTKYFRSLNVTNKQQKT